MPILDCSSLTKSFDPGKEAVSNVSLALDEGDILCLLGPSGCGKTTLLRIIAGLESADGGHVWFDGRDMAAISPHRREFGMMFQDFALFPHKNVFENVAFGLQMHGQGKDDIEQRVEEILQLVDMVGFSQREIDQLSGGEQQRVALARSLAPRPRLLMLDEPLGALDRQLRERLMLDLRAILKNIGVTAIYVTHDQLEAFAIADQIAVMNQGKIEQLEAPETVFKKPATPFVARFLGFQNVILATVIGAHTVDSSLGQFHFDETLPQTGSTVSLLIRPGAATVQASGQEAQTTDLLAEITAVSFRGSYYQVWLRAGQQDLKFDLPTVDHVVGDQIQLSLNQQGISIFPS